MKRLFLVMLMAASFMSCDKDVVQEDPTIEGRWQVVGFDEVIRYEFTEDTRYTIYGSDEAPFPTLEEFIEQNPGLNGNPYEYEGMVVVLDLHFGNYSRLIPVFKCDNDVIEWIDESGASHSTFYREGHDIAACN